MAIDLTPFEAVVPLDHGLCVVVTRRADQTPATVVVNACVLPHPVTGDRAVAFVSAGGTRMRRTAVLVAPSRVYSNPT